MRCLRLRSVGPSFPLRKERILGLKFFPHLCKSPGSQDTWGPLGLPTCYWNSQGMLHTRAWVFSLSTKPSLSLTQSIAEEGLSLGSLECPHAWGLHEGLEPVAVRRRRFKPLLRPLLAMDLVEPRHLHLKREEVNPSRAGWFYRLNPTI